ncbi:MAG: B12-binding domain-containing radical SAM protein [Candidatus Heimdallarchaeaceae archaeon]
MYNKLEKEKELADKRIQIKEEKEFRVFLSTIVYKRKKDPEIPKSLAYIESFCRTSLPFLNKQNFIVKTFTHTEDTDFICSEIKKHSPIIIGFGVYIWNINKIITIVKKLRKLGFEGYIILGGPEVTFKSPELFSIEHLVDYFVKGAGEKAFCHIINAIKNNTKIQMEGVYENLRNSEDVFTSEKIFTEVIPPLISKSFDSRYIGERFARLQTQRGCPYTCTYCAHSMGYRKCTYRSLEYIDKEFEVLKENNVKTVAVIDPVFFLNRKHSLKLLEIKEKIIPEITFELQTRLEILDKSLIKFLEGKNIKLEFGVQSLDQKVLLAIKRNNNIDKILQNLELVSKYMIPFETNLIYGLPFQTYDSHSSDVEILNSYNGNSLVIYRLQLLTGTYLFKQVQREFKSKMFFMKEFPNYVIKTEWLSEEEIKELTSKNTLQSV